MLVKKAFREKNMAICDFTFNHADTREDADEPSHPRSITRIVSSRTQAWYTLITLDALPTV